MANGREKLATAAHATIIGLAVLWIIRMVLDYVGAKRESDRRRQERDAYAARMPGGRALVTRPTAAASLSNGRQF
jgi:hypothetical protein